MSESASKVGKGEWVVDALERCLLDSSPGHGCKELGEDNVFRLGHCKV